MIMQEIIINVITNIATTVYRQFVAALLLAVLFMFVYLYAQEHGWRKAIRSWKEEFACRRVFRNLFFLFFYIAMILLKTLLLREIWYTPWGKMAVGWGLTTASGELTTESIENIILFIPYTFLLLTVVQEQVRGFQNMKLVRMVLWSAFASFYFSMAIELCQGVFWLGTFQWADLAYNTLGGMLGGIFRYLWLKIRKKWEKK